MYKICRASFNREAFLLVFSTVMWYVDYRLRRRREINETQGIVSASGVPAF